MKYLKSYLIFENQKIICQKCGWSWKESNSGKDKYVCHKCGKNNTE